MSDLGSTEPAGEGVSDAEFAREVAEQTSSDLLAEDVFTREADGVSTEVPAAEADADDFEEI